MPGLNKWILVSALLFFCSLTLKPQLKSVLVNEEKYACFIRFSPGSGLKNNVINAISQDSLGFIWIGTEDGLYRYDGYHFQMFACKTETGEKASIITSLCCDFSHNLWIGTTIGLFQLNTISGKIVPFVSGSEQENPILQAHIRKIIFSNDSCLLVETLDGNLCIYSSKNKAWEFISHKPATQPYYRYHALFSDTENNIWFGGRNLGLFRLSSQKKLKHFNAMGNLPGCKRDEDVADVFCTSKKSWYVVATDGIYRFYPNLARFDKIMATSAFSIAEDKNGFIWLGTGNGIAKYDEILQSFTFFRYNPDNNNSLIGNHVNIIFFDRDQNLWIGTSEGLCLLHSKSSDIKMVYRIPGDNNSLSSNKISSIVEDGEHQLWAGTENAGLNKINLVNNEIINFRHQPTVAGSLAANSVSTLYIDKDKKLWIGLWAGIGFCKYNKTKQNFTSYSFEPHSRKKDWYNAFLEDSKGNFWTGIWGARGLHLFDRKTGKFKADYFMLPHSPYYQSAKKIEKLQNGQVFIVTNNELIYEYLPLSKQFKAFAHTSFAKDFTVVPTSHFLFELPFSPGFFHDIATKNNTAFFLSDNGIMQYTPKDGFTTFIKPEKPFSPLSLLVNKNGLYVVFKDKICIYSPSGKELKKYILPSSLQNDINYDSKLIQNNDQLFLITKNTIYKFHGKGSETANIYLKMPAGVKSFTYNEFANELWILCHEAIYKTNFGENPKFVQEVHFTKDQTNNFLSVFEGDHQVFAIGHSFLTSFCKKKTTRLVRITGSPMNKAVSLLSLNDSLVLIADSTNLFQLHLKTGLNELISKPDNFMLASHLISCLFEWNKDTIFIGTTDKGLNWLKPSIGLVMHFNSGSPPNQILPDSITCLEKGKGKKLWVGTTRGLFILDLNEKKIDTANIIAHNIHIQSMQKTSDTSLFIATKNQWVFFNLKSGTYKKLWMVPGHPQLEFTKASCLLNNGNLAYGTNLGLIVFDPRTALYYKQIKRPVHFSHFTLFEKKIKHFFQTPDTVHLKYNENFFTIGFASLNYATSGTQAFYYRLKDIDPNWVKTIRSEASYTNLEPDNYLFEVKLADQQENNEISGLYILISPPFWKTKWFMGLIFLFSISILYYILYLYIKKIKIKQQNTELEQKLLASQMNPHFIFNALAAIQSYMFNNQSEEAGNYLSGFSRLVRLILQNSRSRFIPLDDEIQTLKLYLKLQKLRFADKFEYELSFPPPNRWHDIMVPPMMAQPFIENSIEHGILHKEGNGLILLSITLNEKTICMEICDDGIGIEKSKELNQNQRNHTSFATSITRERLAILEKMYKVKTEISIIDRSVTEQTNGTRVILTIPYIIKSQIPSMP